MSGDVISVVSAPSVVILFFAARGDVDRAMAFMLVFFLDFEWDPDKARLKPGNMSMDNDRLAEDEMRPEYDLRGGVRGKYYKQYTEGTNVVLLDSDVATVFRDSASVNQALRVLIKVAEQLERPVPKKS
jgi:hypothetical protein